jgi:4'-phosphopantetheinyl transferase
MHSVSIWWWDIRREETEFAEALAQLSPFERSRLARIAHPAEQQRFLAGRYALRSTLSECTGLDPRAIRFRANRHGKPFLTSRENRHISFSLSHSGDLVCIAVAQGVRVGVDVELRRPRIDWDSAGELCLHPAEMIQLRRMPIGHRRRAFQRAWCRKEAIVKALGKGMHMPLHTVDAGLFGESSMPGWQVYNLKAKAGYFAALAVETSGDIRIAERRR